ncbi:signal recognition particle-docking protein FtsY [Candidatus Woesearchaeota archaeon]|nr:signal recognition particle-docking protein FtsY [Candidatus Woesearchaeota archaeon]
MFGFLKEKLKKAISSITKKIEEKPVEEKAPEKEVQKEKIIRKKPEVQKEVEIEKEIPKKEEKKGFFEKLKEKVTTTSINEGEFEDIFYDLEIALLENNTAVEVIERIKQNLKEVLVNKPIESSLFDIKQIDFIDLVKTKKPFTILFVGVNGSGKTSTISKIAYLLQKNGLSVVLGAGDSFRMAAIEQLEEWGRRLGVKVIKHEYGSDPTSICFDTVAYAKSHGIDVVLLDSAGRQHSNTDLMEEMKKINRVIKPDLKIFVGEALVGNDILLQAQEFDKAIGIDGLILTKSDVDEKGGAMISTEYVLHKPIYYLTCGQELKDLKEFKKEDILKNLGI